MAESPSRPRSTDQEAALHWVWDWLIQSPPEARPAEEVLRHLKHLKKVPRSVIREMDQRLAAYRAARAPVPVSHQDRPQEPRASPTA